MFFIRDGKARVAVVQLGAVDGDMIQILSGITADFVVATDHLQDLFDGEPVVTEASSPIGSRPVGQASRPAADARVGLVLSGQSRTVGSGADEGVRPTAPGRTTAHA